ncbi:MAG: hypothetical protein CM1200mP26_12400 [Acidimicrobiales bacterium]|nr:MAG: hypothetical protein CM1200mP26_12400 [Acidimicrobiales bacterium]
MMKFRFASPEMLVDINNIPGLAYHSADPDGTYESEHFAGMRISKKS